MIKESPITINFPGGSSLYAAKEPAQEGGENQILVNKDSHKSRQHILVNKKKAKPACQPPVNHSSFAKLKSRLCLRHMKQQPDL